MIQKPKGTRDILPEEIEVWQYIENATKNIFESYAFKEIRVPVFENTELFLRGVGETTDVVQKEMYTFEDKGGRSITLRPEGTASCVRAYIENGMSSLPSPLKLWYNITTYRYENVQKGRYREFRQLGAELIGTSSYMADAEIIIMANSIFENLNIRNIELEINSIGCLECRKQYQKKLKEYVESNIEDYCNDCKNRLEKNPMRILDCKNENCKSKNGNAPVITDYLCEECLDHFENVKKVLDYTEINYIINPKIVRGLDYYTKTVFEFIAKDFGYTVLAGGRYDGLIKQIEGQDTPAIGFAMGVDRLVEIYKNYNNKEFSKRVDLFIATIGDKASMFATKLVKELRDKDIIVEKDICNRSLKAQFKYANRIQARYVITLGDTEIETNTAKIKDMSSGNEKDIILDDIDKRGLFQNGV